MKVLYHCEFCSPSKRLVENKVIEVKDLITIFDHIKEDNPAFLSYFVEEGKQYMRAQYSANGGEWQESWTEIK